MTDIQDDKPTKLTLSKSTLSLNKPINFANVKHNILSAKSNTIVEVKKSKNPGNLSLKQNPSMSTGDTSVEEFNKRLNLLKKASEDLKNQDTDNKISGLSKIVAMNQVKNDDVTETTKTANAEKNNLHDTQQQKTQSDHKETQSLRAPNVEVDEDTNKKLDGKSSLIKNKVIEPKKLNKSEILTMLGSDSDEGLTKTRSLASIKRAKEKEKRKITQTQKPEKIYREVTIPETVTVGDLAAKMTERSADVIRELMKLGIIATVNQVIDADTAELIVTTFGHNAKRIQESDVENVLIQAIDDPKSLKPRAPVVTIMGHVDHGKTSLLDALKLTDVVSGESGGITQHIGAYQVKLANGKSITFIDTPGHEAFTEMRIRGAQVTDIVVLVVAADDGIKAQTIEAINHAKAAKVPIIVAVNKIDKPDINIDRIKNELLTHDLVAEDLGGDILIVPVSALKKTNLDKLEETILLVAEMQNLVANPDAKASGIVIEAKIDKGKGVISTVLVQRGTLQNGDLIVAGSSYGRIKQIKNDKGFDTTRAGPSEPVEIYGLNEPPSPGDKFDIIQNERQAKNIAEYRVAIAKRKKIAITKGANLEDLFAKASGIGNNKELNLIIKGDVQGSIEAIASSLLKLPNNEVSLKILHQAVGGITESDVTLATASNALIIGFNVRANKVAAITADKSKVDIRYYSIIYNLIDDVKSVLSGMLSPIIREEFIGSVEIRQIFNITKVGKVAGSYVTKGIIKRGAGVRLLRDDIVIHEGKLKTLRRFKDDVKDVKEGFECGIAFEHYDDIKIGDCVEVFELITEKQRLL